MRIPILRTMPKEMVRTLVIVFSLSLCNCVHEYADDYEEPTPQPPDPVTPSTKLVVSLQHETSMPLWAQIATGSRSRSDIPYDVRHTINLYPIESKAGEKVSSRVPQKTIRATYPIAEGLDRDLEIEIDPGLYNVLAWTDYVPEGTSDDHHYLTSDFSQITLVDAGDHPGCDEYRDAFKGANEGYVALGETSYVTIPLQRPMAKYYFIANDLREFAETIAKYEGSRSSINFDDYQVVFRYTGYMPYIFNIFTDHPADSRMGVYFKGQMRELNEEELELGFDYVMTNGIDTSVAVAVDIYDKNNNLLARSETINVPLKRSHYTEVRGPFLTTRNQEAVGIDPGFDGEFNIQIKQ